MPTLTAYSDGQVVSVYASEGGAFVMLFAGNNDNDRLIRDAIHDLAIVELTPDEARAVAESLKLVADEVDLAVGR